MFNNHRPEKSFREKIGTSASSSPTSFREKFSSNSMMPPSFREKEGFKQAPSGRFAKRYNILGNSTLSFKEKLELEGKKQLMLYRGRTVATKREFIAYIVCDAFNVEKMHADYNHGVKVDSVEEYGEVAYMDYVPNPDEKAEEFIEQWKKDNDFS